MFSWIVRHPLPVIAATIAMTIGLASGLPRLELDPDTEAYVPENHPIRVYWQEARDRFGIGREILIAVEVDSADGIFTPETLTAIVDLTDGIKAIDGVIENNVSSIADADAMLGTRDGLEVEPVIDGPIVTRADAEAVRKRIFDNPVLVDRLVSSDSTIASIIVRTRHDDEVEGTQLYERIAAYVDTVEIPGARILVAGSPAVEFVYGRQMASDLSRLIPMAMFAVIAILFLCFPGMRVTVLLKRAAPLFVVAAAVHWYRGVPGAWTTVVGVPLAFAMMTTRGVSLPSLVVALSVIWTWGLQGLLGLPIYIAGTLVPPLLLAIGCADGIHVLERYFDTAAQHGPHTNRNHVIVATMDELWRPIVLTSVTTAIGFGSLMLGSMTVYQVFGFTTAFGILIAMVISLTLLPATLALLPLPAASERKTGPGRLSALLTVGAEWIEGHRKLTLVASLAVLVACAVNTRHLVVDYSWVESLAPDTDVLLADRLLRDRHGGTMPMNIIVRAAEPDGMKDPELLRAIDRVLDGMAESSFVGDTRSIAEYIARMNQAMNEDRIDMMRIPDTREMVAQYLLVYSMSGDPGEFDDVVDYDYTAANAAILLRTDRLSVIGDMVARAEHLLDVHVRPLGATATITGAAQVQHTVLDMILVSQVYSLVTASVLVFAFMWLLFRSLTDALICMIPPLLTGVVNFGAMGAFGIPLGPDKAMISAIALGIGIDYSIHLMARFLRLRQSGAPVYLAIVEATSTTGRAIVFNAVVVVVGFLVLGMSQSPSNAAFGRLIASNMAVACLSALVIVPVALAITSSLEDERARRRGVVVAGRRLRSRTAHMLGLGAADA